MKLKSVLGLNLTFKSDSVEACRNRVHSALVSCVLGTADEKV
jgi:hypothetical protein